MAFVIGLIYSRNENWVAGSYYVQNLVSALRSLPDATPQLKIYSENQTEFEELRRITEYPDMEWVPLIDRNTLIDKIINKISYKTLGRHLITRGIDVAVDFIFPAENSYFFDRIDNKLFWIPDFQEHYYPRFFSSEEIQKRKRFQAWLIQKKHPIVFSSRHAANNFNSLYPRASNQVFVMPFAVTIPDLSAINIGQLQVKYELPEQYFICSNQFWPHKNHITVLKALLRLREEGWDVKLVFTGKQAGGGIAQYFSNLMNFVDCNQLGRLVKFLGFIDRSEQLVLMKNSLAVIQPSLFEGWSTVVEDAKALNVPVIVSDIPVHHEQLGRYPFYFSAEDDEHLASHMKALVSQKVDFPMFDYQKQIKDFGSNFRCILSEIKR